MFTQKLIFHCKLSYGVALAMLHFAAFWQYRRFSAGSSLMYPSFCLLLTYNCFLQPAASNRYISAHSFIHIIDQEAGNYKDYYHLVKESRAFISINKFSETLFSQLARLPPSLIILNIPSKAILNSFKSLTRHVILVQGLIGL